MVTALYVPINIGITDKTAAAPQMNNAAFPALPLIIYAAISTIEIQLKTAVSRGEKLAYPKGRRLKYEQVVILAAPSGIPQRITTPYGKASAAIAIIINGDKAESLFSVMGKVLCSEDGFETADFMFFIYCRPFKMSLYILYRIFS